MKKSFVLLSGSAIAIATTIAAFGIYQPTQAQAPANATQNCVYLREVTTGKPDIRKVVATNNSNANVDFAVPTGIAFTSYIGEFIPENNASYQVNVNLKYNDGTSSRVVSRTVQARRFYLYRQPFQAPTSNQPFQINSNITSARNNAYTVAFLACR